MGTQQTRQLRIAEQIQKDLSALIRLRVKDPRVGMVTVTYVEVAADYGHAKVFVSSLLGDASLAQTLQGLQEAAGFLRRELGRGLKLRVTPQLHFVADASIERGVRMGALIGSALAADALLTGGQTTAVDGQAATAGIGPDQASDDPKGDRNAESRAEVVADQDTAGEGSAQAPGA
jgi:ribosome-binding factor A